MFALKGEYTHFTACIQHGICSTEIGLEFGHLIEKKVYCMLCICIDL